MAGVGHGEQVCHYDCEVPITLSRVDGTTSSGSFTAPTIENSNLPALLGLQSLIDSRAILDLTTLRIHFCGPGDTQLQLPPGSESYQCEKAPSGHLMLPCDQPAQEPRGNFILDSPQLSLQAESVPPR